MPVWSSMNNSRNILHMCAGFTQPLATQIQWSMLFLCSLGWLAITDFGSIINILGRYVELVRISELRWIVAHFYGTQMNINLWSGQKKNQWCTFLKFALIFSVLFFHIYRPWHTQSYFICIFWWVFAMIFERYRKNGIRHKKGHKLEKKVRCRLWKVDLYVNKFEYNLFGLNREAVNIVIGHTAESSNWAWWFNI